MYQLYKEKYLTAAPVSEKFYRDQFNYGFNLSFLKPRKDQCDRCVQYKATKNPTAEESLNYQGHKTETRGLKAERDLDRQNADPNIVVICFDLQSVFPLPKGFASSFYYKRKINVYNMTATVIFSNKDKFTYCCVWDETNSGRGGASCLYKILTNLLTDFPHIKHIIMWSDSCVPQNKNKIMSTALLRFMSDNPGMKTLTQKFSEPGHSQIQEVDCVHSAIDRYLKGVERYSIVSLLSFLKQIKFANVKLKLMQMRPQDFKVFVRPSEQLNFSGIPFTKVKVLQYSQGDPFTVKYKTSVLEIMYKSSNILLRATSRKLGTPANIFKQNLTTVDRRLKINKEKVDDIKSLFNYMPEVDKTYYRTVLKI